MKTSKPLTRCLFLLAVLVVFFGCAKTTVTERHPQMGTQKIPKPERIYVFPFAATPADIPAWSSSASKYSASSEPQTAEELEAGRKLGQVVAEELVTEIQMMGMSALVGNAQTVPRLNDILIIGYFESIDKGSRAKRLGLGFGSGAAELRTAAEGYQMTSNGLRLLGSGKLDSAGNKMPGVAAPLIVLAATANPVGLIVGGAAHAYGEYSGKDTIEGAGKRTAEEIAKVLRERFQEQGWI